MILAQVSSFWLPVEASTFAKDVDWLFYFIYYLSWACFIPIVVGMVYFVAKHRRKSPTEVPRGVPAHHLPLELSWTIGPSVIVVFIFVWGFYDFMRERTPPEGAYKIRVKAQKWSWSFEYPQGLISNELHLPKGRPIHFVMTSADVLHAMYIPAFRAKIDIVPGRYNDLWVEPTLNGEFPLYCAEYCGALDQAGGGFTGHSGMRAKVVVHEPAEFEKWFTTELEKQRNLPPVQMGARVYTIKGCSTCHTIDGSPRVGPSFKDLWGKEEQMEDGRTFKVDDNYVRESILEPAASIVKGYAGKNMPSFKGVLSDREIEGVFAYLESLNPSGPKKYSIATPAGTHEATHEATGEKTAEPAKTGEAPK